MLSSDSPFPLKWIGSDLENVGLKAERPDLGTYGDYSYEQLPPLPFTLNGDFAWLTDGEIYADGIGVEMAEEILKVPQLKTEASKRRINLPEPFLRFIESPDLYECIRSNTDCYSNLCSEPVRSPIGEGFLVRFLADSQGCVYWYLYVASEGQDYAVVCSPDYYDVDYPESREEPPNPDELVYCAESFESFICRFWLENEIWFSAFEKRPMLEAGIKYVESYRGRVG